MEIRCAEIADIQGVISLQKQYLFNNLTEEERKDGFVTTPFTEEQIRVVILNDNLFIAVVNDVVVAYIFAGTWDYFAQWPIFPYMVSFFPQLKFHDLSTENSFQYGPVCIDRAYRGSKVLKSLFEVMRLEMYKRYPLSATFINQANARSLKAHVDKLGWSIVGEFQYNSQEYFILAYDMKQPVLPDPEISSEPA